MQSNAPAKRLRRLLAAGAARAMELHRLPPDFLTPLRGASALEIGGPSRAFRTGGRLPVYGVLDSIDGTNFSPDAMWGTGDAGGAYAPEGERRGRMWFLEGGDLAQIPAATYDAVLSAHVIEHLADPIGALGEWARVVRPGGHLLLVAPHKERTIDHRRPVTAIRHIVEDHERQIGEDDTTHVQEVLELHDLARDDGVSDREEFERRTRDNPTHRALHHHVFTTRSLLQLLDRCGLRIQAAAARLPGDVFVLAQVAADGEPPDNSTWLAPRARPLRRSPFRLDRAGLGAPDLARESVPATPPGT